MWTLKKLDLFSDYMTPRDRYDLLVEEKFIVNTEFKCGNKNCMLPRDRDKFRIVTDNDKAVKIVLQCDGKVMDRNGFKEKACKMRKSVRLNTWFSASKLNLAEILTFTYDWWHQYTPISLEHEMGFASHTLADWGSFCREVAIEEVIEKSERIGGYGKFVEIDESMFGRSN